MRAPKPKVLVAYEDVKDLRGCCAVLRQESYDPTCLTSFTEGADRLAREAFDLVILSKGSPDFDGQTVVARAIEKNRRTPVLVLARSVDMNCHLETMQSGAIDCLERPTLPSETAKLVAMHLPANARSIDREGFMREGVWAFLLPLAEDTGCWIGDAKLPRVPGENAVAACTMQLCRGCA